MKHLEKILAILMLLFAIGFNLWLYRLEPTATIDPNDNAFQFALVDRTNQIWDFASKKCSSKFGAWNLVPGAFCQVSYLADHWVPNWAEGYNLPFYYGHVPQILIVSSYRFLQLFTFPRLPDGQDFSLFTYYHWVTYLILSLFPLSVFLALRVIKLPWLTAGIGALLASHISTDGLYGLDPPSFLWRGYGLSSQLFAMVSLPLAIAFSSRFFSNQESGSMNYELREKKRKSLLETSYFIIRNSYFAPAVLALVLTAMGHLGLGIIAMLSLIPLALASPILHLLHHESIPHIFEVTKNELTKLLLLAGTVIFFLSYWVVPIMLADNYHNISFWDPPWKFASYGARETITRLLNGDLFDWGRGPWMTALVMVGLIGAAWPKREESGIRNQESGQNNRHPFVPMIHDSYFMLPVLFIFWLLLYFGRTTWGPLIDLIPGMKEFHLSRFIVGVHTAGLFLMSIGIQWIIQILVSTCQRINVSRYVRLKMPSFIGLLVFIVIPPIYKQTIEYALHNDRLIKQANENHAKVKTDEEALFAAIRSLPPGRVFAGRGGWWGKDFRVAETPYYMHLSTYGIPTVLWLPETWSPNSDVEQYFSEDQAKDYDLFGIRYVAAPPKQEAQKFWKLISERPTWKLYKIDTSDLAPRSLGEGGYFTTGIRPAVVATDKRSYGSIVRLWIQSDQTHTRGLYPELTFAKDYPKNTGLPNLKMIDEVTYVVPDLPAGRQAARHNLFQEPPVYLPPAWEKLSNYPMIPASPAGRQLSNKSNESNSPNLPYLPMKLVGPEEVDSDMVFKTKVEVGDNCAECIVVLKQSFHPNWRVTIDGKPAKAFTVFPFYLATLVPSGTHEIIFSYEPSRLKIALLVLEMVTLVNLIALAIRARFLIGSFSTKL